jgi:nucleoside-diphosphate-sugar epimerase
MKFTIFGGRGFIGSQLAKHVRSRGFECETPVRGSRPTGNLGQVVWCAGLTADFRQRPFETVTAHVCDLLPVLQQAAFDSFLYLSSTRVYQNSPNSDEDSPLVVSSMDPPDLYNLSKLMGESICLNTSRPRVRVARLSNVYGPGPASDSFLGQVVGAACRGKLLLRTSPESAKDYISIHDVVDLLLEIALSGTEPI